MAMSLPRFDAIPIETPHKEVHDVVPLSVSRDGVVCVLCGPPASAETDSAISAMIWANGHARAFRPGPPPKPSDYWLPLAINRRGDVGGECKGALSGFLLTQGKIRYFNSPDPHLQETQIRGITASGIGVGLYRKYVLPENSYTQDWNVPLAFEAYPHKVVVIGRSEEIFCNDSGLIAGYFPITPHGEPLVSELEQDVKPCRWFICTNGIKQIVGRGRVAAMTNEGRILLYTTPEDFETGKEPSPRRSRNYHTDGFIALIWQGGSLLSLPPTQWGGVRPIGIDHEGNVVGQAWPATDSREHIVYFCGGHWRQLLNLVKGIPDGCTIDRVIGMDSRGGILVEGGDETGNRAFYLRLNRNHRS